METTFTYTYSYWAFVWYLLYEIRVIPYSPKLALLVAFFGNLIAISFMIYYQNSWARILLFSLINFILKCVPLWTIRRIPFVFPKDIITTLFSICLYLLWLSFHDETIYTAYDYKLIQENKPIGPLSTLLERWIQLK